MVLYRDKSAEIELPRLIRYKVLLIFEYTIFLSFLHDKFYDKAGQSYSFGVIDAVIKVKIIRGRIRGAAALGGGNESNWGNLEDFCVAERVSGTGRFRTALFKKNSTGNTVQLLRRPGF